MLGWMQKHKKYLVVTIWISVIAFVGAGFVGWGSYDFGSSAKSVVQVGDVHIGARELAKEYERLRSLALSMGADTQKNQKELKRLALSNLIERALLKQFALDHDLRVSDGEVASAIAAQKSFWNNGRFDKDLYLRILRQNRLTPKEYEEVVREDLLLKKVLAALDPVLYDLEFNTTASAFFIADKITYRPLDAEDIEVKVSQKEVRAFYETNSDLFMTPPKAKVAFVEINASQIPPTPKEQLLEYYKSHKSSYRAPDGKILPFEAAKEQVAGDLAKKLAKKEALKRYIAFKKGQIAPDREEVVELSKRSTLSPQLIQAIKDAKEGDILKPHLIQNEYVVAKIIKKLPPAPMPFEKVQHKAKKLLLAQKRSRALEDMAKKMVKKGFDGERTDFICRDDIGKINGLERDEAAFFLKNLFISKELKGAVKVSDVKIVLFKIDDQKLGHTKKIQKNRYLLKEGAMELKKRLQYNGLVQKLKSIYPPKSSSKDHEWLETF
jgi:peptidyl-prolyl cis-trans isomerase D